MFCINCFCDHDVLHVSFSRFNPQRYLEEAATRELCPARERPVSGNMGKQSEPLALVHQLHYLFWCARLPGTSRSAFEICSIPRKSPNGL